MTIARRVVVHGRVQGVFFRETARRRARRAGVAGWVRNNEDGSVEAVFSGSPDVVAEMLERCKDGPPDARVTVVIVTDEGGAPPTGFTVLATDRWR